jgi:hypothetical protein
MAEPTIRIASGLPRRAAVPIACRRFENARIWTVLIIGQGVDFGLSRPLHGPAAEDQRSSGQTR